MQIQRLRSQTRLSPHARPRTGAALLGLLALALMATTGCDLLTAATQNSNCVTHSTNFQGMVAQEGQLQAEVSTQNSDYPMAIVLSQVAVNKFFAAVASADIPTLRIPTQVLGVPVTVAIDPSLPLLQIGGEKGCATCILTELAFGLSVDVAGFAVGGTGKGRYQFPLTMTANGMESTSLHAQLGQSEVLGIELNISGLDSAIFQAIEPLVANAVTGLIRNSYGDTHLFDLNAWQIGNGDVRLLGRGPHIDAEQRTIVIGMHTNLVRPLGNSVAWNPALPTGADIGLQFHPELLQVMIGRMMNEGHIPRSYDATGQPEDGGAYQTTLNAMAPSQSGALATSFRLWRTSGGFCGFADLEAGMSMAISDRKLAFNIDGIKVTQTEGAGDLLRLADAWLGADFLNKVTNFTQLTVNYNEFDLPGGKVADMSAESFQLNLDARGLSLFLNIDAIIDGN